MMIETQDLTRQLARLQESSPHALEVNGSGDSRLGATADSLQVTPEEDEAFMRMGAIE